MTPPSLTLPHDEGWRKRIEALLSKNYAEPIASITVRGQISDTESSEFTCGGGMMTTKIGNLLIRLYPDTEAQRRHGVMQDYAMRKKTHEIHKDTWSAELLLGDGTHAQCPVVWATNSSTEHSSSVVEIRMKTNQLEDIGHPGTHGQTPDPESIATRITLLFPGHELPYAQHSTSKGVVEESIQLKPLDLRSARHRLIWHGKTASLEWAVLHDENGLALIIDTGSDAISVSELRQLASGYVNALSYALGRRLYRVYEKLAVMIPFGTGRIPRETHSGCVPFRGTDHYATPLDIHCEQFHAESNTARLINEAAAFFSMIDSDTKNLARIASSALWAAHGATSGGIHKDTSLFATCAALEGLIECVAEKLELNSDALNPDFASAKQHAVKALAAHPDFQSASDSDKQRIISRIKETNPGSQKHRWQQTLTAIGFDWATQGEPLFKCWRDIRHKAAHGVSNCAYDMNISDLFDAEERLQLGLNTIVAALSGYFGPIRLNPGHTKPVDFPGLPPDTERKLRPDRVAARQVLVTSEQ